MVFLIYLSIGIVTSFLSGLLGIGGGLLILPALIYTFTYFHVVDTSQVMHMVIGTSLASSLFNLVFSVRAHHLRKVVQWPIVLSMMPGLLLGALLLGPLILRVMSSEILKGFFAGFCVFMAVQMAFQKNKEGQKESRLPSTALLVFWGLLVGILSTLLGLAGGVLVGLILNYYRMDMHKIVGTGAACALIVSFAATLGLMLFSGHQEHLPAWSTGFVYWPAFLGVALPSVYLTKLGASLTHRLSVTVLRKLFSLLVFIIGMQMLLSIF